jgi:hypothetical protein
LSVERNAKQPNIDTESLESLGINSGHYNPLNAIKSSESFKTDVQIPRSILTPPFEDENQQ